MLPCLAPRRRSRPLPVFLLAFCAFFAAAAHAQSRFDFDRTPGRLSKDIVPVRYELALDVDPERDSFTGEVAITLRVRKPVDAIELHADQLQTERLELVGDGAATRELAAKSDTTAQTWTLTPRDGAPIAAGEQRLRIAYRGAVQSRGTGLYRATARTSAGEEHMLATQLASIHARNLVPTFDEPAFRAVFELTVRAPARYEVLANMPVVESRNDGAAAVHRFAPTPAMPSYLLALAVGRFDVLVGAAAGVPLRIFTAPGKREQGDYAMAVTRQVLPFYVQYFGVPYALPKLDLLAVPSTRQGAMEDWGLISFAEPFLLYDPERSTPYRQRRVFDLVAHEIAHMWFGNLVTHASWDEIWLNEAFATWIAVKLTDHFNPNWQVALQRRADLESVMQRDAGTATRAIRSGPVNERAVYDVLDTITYEKGGAVLSMLEQWIGSRPFQRGLASYIQERRYSNATAGDLWHHIGAASGRDVAAVARSWTDQPGYPLVTVNTRCHNGQTIARLGQRRFMLAAGKIEPGTWQIPMLIESAGNKTSVLLDADLAEIVLPGCAPLIVNAGGLGYYRVDYPAPARRELTRRFVRLEPADRVTLLSDRLALVQAGRVPAQEYFDLLAQLPRVEDASRVGLYRMAINGLALLDAALANTPAQPQLRAAARALLGPELARIGWSAQPGEDLQLPLLRSELILQLARFGDLDVIATARRAYIAADNGTALPAATRSAITQVVGTVADAAAFEQLRTRLVEARSEEERWIHALALARVNDPALADRVLKLSLEGSLPPNIAKELPALMAGLSSHVARAYDFTRRYWTELARLAGTFNNADAWLLAEAAMHSNDRAMITRLLRDDAATQTASRAPAAEAAERIRLLADVRDREAKSLAATLAGWRPAR